MSTETKTLTNADAKIQPKLGVKALVQIGMLSAIAIILMMFEIPLPFAPTFYKIDLSEVPVLVGCFAMGPMAGVLVELVKILLNFVMTGTSTAGVGEIANFIIGCSFCVPAGLIYRKNRTRKSALIGMATGTLLMIVIGCFVNGFVLLPTYAKAFGMPIDALVGMGTAVNSQYYKPFYICYVCGSTVQPCEGNCCITCCISDLQEDQPDLQNQIIDEEKSLR